MNTNHSPKIDTICKPSFEIRFVLNLPKVVFPLEANRILLLGLSSCLPLQSKRKLESQVESRYMFSDMENLHIMLGGNSLDREERISSNLGRKPESPCYGNLLNQNGQSYSKSREAGTRS